MNTREGMIITVRFEVPTTNRDEAYQAVHALLGDKDYDLPEIYDVQAGMWIIGDYDIDPEPQRAVFEIDEDRIAGIVDVESEVRF